MKLIHFKIGKKKKTGNLNLGNIENMLASFDQQAGTFQKIIKN